MSLKIAILVEKGNQRMTRFTPLLLAALVMLPSPALPNDGQITLVVGFAAGGTSSTAARIVAEAAEQIARTSTIVENRPGAGGAIAADWVLRQKGTQTLLFMSSTSSLRTSPQSELVPVGVLATFSYVAVTRKDAAAHLAEYMQEASREEKYRTVGHVAAAIVPFPDFLPFQDSLHILAQTGRGIETEGWVGIFAPPGTSAEEVSRLSEISRQASQRSQEKLQNVGFKQVWRSSAEARAMHEKDYTQWTPILKVLGIQP
nr:tripartite tricarboxylate transporter substrate-binding protein [Bradyrhizobium elkanii]